MTFDLGLFSSKLQKYRNQFNASPSQVATATGIPEDTLFALEHGSKQPTGDEVLILADYYKCDYQFFISNEQVAPFEQTEMLFRKYGNEFSNEDRWAVQEFLFLCECEEFLLQSLSKSNHSTFNFEKRGTYHKEHGEEAAKELRRYLGYTFNQVGSDIYEDFRSLGIHVFRRQLINSNVSGLFIKHPQAGKCILINYNEDIYRQRFSAAHEAAHAILDYDQDFVVSLKTDKQNWIDVEILQKRMNLSKGELTSIVFAKKTRQAFLTDDQKARKLASKVMQSDQVQTMPHLLGWLFFVSYLNDNDFH
ncbi:MAG: XRE family transcriptional regulator, partial [Rhizonema sp. PD37]|nr:XRE family transcriptional regulator [Rhizonema sp. PD37]